MMRNLIREDRYGCKDTAEAAEAIKHALLTDLVKHDYSIQGNTVVRRTVIMTADEIRRLEIIRKNHMKKRHPIGTTFIIQ